MGYQCLIVYSQVTNPPNSRKLQVLLLHAIAFFWNGMLEKKEGCQDGSCVTRLNYNTNIFEVVW